ncbi:NADPH-dependent FMN reductase [Xylariales sp. AK1849]|nr:NADPH-dependent FMN reductase [Xylariales sp. AK1849]
MPTSTFKVGVICGSQRVVQAGSQITDFIEAVIRKHVGSSDKIELVRINIKDLHLPLLDEPGLPKFFKFADDYKHEHTKQWSRTVNALHAFVFVTPDYNSNVPAGLKNALDYLWHEWAGKPAMIVSYGGAGGLHSYASLKLTCSNGLQMRTVNTAVNLKYGSFEMLLKAASGEDLALVPINSRNVWAGDIESITQAFDELVDLLRSSA